MYFGRSFVLNLLEIQQEAFSFQTACVTRQRIAGAHTAMAGDDDGNWIFTHSLPDSLGGHFLPAEKLCRLVGKASVGNGFSPGNIQKQLPNKHLKRGTLWFEG